jgi:hypothetical protein
MEVWRVWRNESLIGGGGVYGARKGQMDHCFVLKPAWEIAEMIQNGGRIADTALHWALRSLAKTYVSVFGFVIRL